MRNLTKKGFWIKSLEKVIFPHTLNIKYYPYFISLNKIFKKFLPKDTNLTIFEIGCAPGCYLIYFNKTFGFRPFGIDFIKEGVEKTKVNLENFGIDSSGIYFGDIFSEKEKFPKFDLVFSGGFVEHFSDLQLTIDIHTKFLKRGGYLIITVPNFRSKFYRTLQKFLNKEDYYAHMEISKKDILICIEKDYEIIFLDYVGFFDLGILRSNVYLIDFLIRTFNKFIQSFLFLFKIKRTSSFLSPSMALIAKLK